MCFTWKGSTQVPATPFPPSPIPYPMGQYLDPGTLLPPCVIPKVGAQISLLSVRFARHEDD